MCVGALLESNVGELVFAIPDPRSGAAGGAIQIAQHDGMSRRLRVVSGIRRNEAEELLAQAGSKGR
jgi:tRNA(adenine34) deaminase